MSCSICCENYNQSQRKSVKCGYCEFEACRTCCETYMLSETVPRCMSPECGKEWSRQFLVAQFTPAFVNKRYKEHRENILLQRELSMMPATQQQIEEEKRQLNIRTEIQAFIKWRKNLDYDLQVLDKLQNLDKYSQIKDNHQLDVLYKTNETIESWMVQRFKQIRKQETILSNQIDKLESELRRTPQQERRAFVHACPDNECRGFLSQRWKCGICDKYTCPECHELKVGDEHTCDPNVVENVKLLQQDSKPCPKCASRIFKISGCDHMWCTSCHTGFNWKTGRIEERPENPHYYEWLRRGGGAIPREPGDVPCGGGAGDYIRIIDAVFERHKCNAQKVKRLKTILTNHQHNYHTERARYAQFDAAHVNERHRRDYLLKKLDDKELKRCIQINEKKHQKNRELHNVLELSCNMVRDIAMRAKAKLEETPVPGLDLLEPFMVEMNNAIAYCNELLRDIATTYGSVRYEFDAVFWMHSTNTKAYKEMQLKKAAAAAPTTTTAPAPAPPIVINLV